MLANVAAQLDFGDPSYVILGGGSSSGSRKLDWVPTRLIILVTFHATGCQVQRREGHSQTRAAQ